MHEKEPAVSEIEGRARRGVELKHVGFDQRKLCSPLGAEVGERVSAKLAVDLDAGDAAFSADAIGHEPHHGARSRAHIERAHPGGEADPVEHLLGRPLPHERLIAQALIFVSVSRMDIAVGVQFLRLSRHPPHLLLRR